jgi:riboflavin-specific deaminase-like protein
MSARPHISINMVMSLDGKISTVSREPALFSSPRDKKLLIELRARADAVVAGARTVATNTMGMGVRPAQARARAARGKPPHPLRVIVSGTLGSLRPGLKVFKRKLSPVLIFCSSRAPVTRRKAFSRFAEVIVCGRDKVDLRRMGEILQSRFGVRHLHGEGGAELNGGLLDAGLVDELDLTIAGVFFGGGRALTLFGGCGRARIARALELKLVSLRREGNEVFLKYKRRRSG